jgi:LmbE family N-acetylglucosaminyl deacetylase|tara:strand:- start:5594 stop:6238 length:645 start_codon:yes stop_codon:yes gene_type:complete
MKFLNFKRVLCLSPHPDDVEYSMLGTIAKKSNTKFDIFCLSRGGAKGFDVTNEQDRRKEVHDVWSKARCKNIKLLWFSDSEYIEDKSEPEWINYIEKTFLNVHEYDCILIPPSKDSMYEHRFVNKFGDALVRKNTISLIEYKTVSTLNTWIPNMFVDVTNFYDRKLESLKEFKSQNDKLYFQKPTLDSFHSNFQCKKRGKEFVEQFRIIEIFRG